MHVAHLFGCIFCTSTIISLQLNAKGTFTFHLRHCFPQSTKVMDLLTHSISNDYVEGTLFTKPGLSQPISFVTVHKFAIQGCDLS